MQSPPQYPGAPYYPMATENLLKKRYVLALNALGLLAIWLATIIVIWTNDLNARGFARFLTISGGLIAAFGSVAAALGSKRTDRKSTRLNSSHANSSYAVFCLKKTSTSD